MKNILFRLGKAGLNLALVGMIGVSFVSAEKILDVYKINSYKTQFPNSSFSLSDHEKQTMGCIVLQNSSETEDITLDSISFKWLDNGKNMKKVNQYMAILTSVFEKPNREGGRELKPYVPNAFSDAGYKVTLETYGKKIAAGVAETFCPQVRKAGLFEHIGRRIALTFSINDIKSDADRVKKDFRGNRFMMRSLKIVK